MKKVEKRLNLGGRELIISTGELAEQSSFAILAQYGETVVLATVVAAPLKQELDYFPLSVDYQERLYAGGRIKGSRWVKREGRPLDEEILTARLIDRSIRPLFPKEYKKEVQVIVTALSVDMENDPKDVAPIAVSAALAASPIPWYGPVSTLRIGMKNGQGSYFVNPTDSEIPFSNMELVVSCTKDAVVMIEAGANEAVEEDILGGIEFACRESLAVIDFINDFAKEAGRKKEVLEKKVISADLVKTIKKLAESRIDSIIKSMAQKEGGYEEFNELVESVKEHVEADEKGQVLEIVNNMLKERIREMILNGERPDGRKHDQIRSLSSRVGVLPRTHGSAIFKRGATQALSVATLGTPSMGQLIETAEGEEEKRYMHHYSMPPFATGETGKIGSPNRREIGHGALAERALLPVIPTEEEFPYTIRVVSEILSSNGSTSMAATCGSTLSLMDAGVPIKAPVSGIAMGLVIESPSDKAVKDKKPKYAILSDIIGLEDFNGDMDFKVAGTAKGITAIQLDVKTINLSLEILKKALEQAKTGRAEILKSMLKSINAPRDVVSTYAPKVKTVRVPVEKIGEIIGPGGKMIKKIMADTKTQLDVEDDGTINVSGMSEDSVAKAIGWIEGIIKEIAPGEVYEGVVRRIQPFGVFVEILPGKEGLVHVSDMSEGYVADPKDIANEGDNVTVRVKEIDKMGRINLSMILDPAKEKSYDARTSSKERHVLSRERGGFRSNDLSTRRDFGLAGRGLRDSRQRGNRRNRGSGPHFPASRLVSTDKKRFGR